MKSNAILLAAGGASVGVGMGQVNRVDSARLAVARAGNRAAGSVASSDAYFPFPDGFEILAEAGVRAVAEPGGSIRDEQRDRGRAGGGRHAVLHRRPALLPLGCAEGELGPQRERASILDGKATAAAVKADLKERVAAFAARGIMPGLGTILVGDDPGSRAYVAGKHRDCAQVGIASIRRDLPARPRRRMSRRPCTS